MVVYMYFNNLKNLRIDNDFTQDYIATKLDSKRGTYATWEKGTIMIPLEKADELSLLYKVRLSYILGLDKNYISKPNIKPINYKLLLENLYLLKAENKYTYEKIAEYLKCNRSTCQRYYNGTFTIPIDRLILLAEFFDIDLDKLCGKE